MTAIKIMSRTRQSYRILNSGRTRRSWNAVPWRISYSECWRFGWHWLRL